MIFRMCGKVSSRTSSGSLLKSGRAPTARAQQLCQLKVRLKLLEALLGGIAQPSIWQQRAVSLAISLHGEKLTRLPWDVDLFLR